ncbi:inosine guanosine and xanthosine phosphorylase family protein [Neolentinus lepideus HHB14362 ss-1]|uniref:Purine nucleoside phosphorylase n=1 Tax=Neolentinus lepideus HHB14362 ss-1 TaxID=1314782 RepID=A0A165UK79_9AGAM|nr:inosine guanosine and xanthosine phosphorylase family protein [Neolentinus lepideus HHB14362 ss-1]
MSAAHEDTSLEFVASNLDILATILPERLLKPQVGIVCGSGLSTLAASFRERVEVPYSSLKGFGISTVHGHKSALAFGLVGPGDGIPVVAMLGRFHAYEGHSLSTVVYPIRVMARLGVKNVIITNAAGSLDPALPVGTSRLIVSIRDHLALPDLTGFNPLLGPAKPQYPRFLPLSAAYSHSLRRTVFFAAHELGLPPSALGEGTYAWVSGPTYESPAEGRFLRAAGASVVGMSTVPEVLAAREEGIEVCVLSLVTNFVVIPDGYRSVREEVDAELSGRPLPPVPQVEVSHEEVLAIGKEKSEVMRSLVEKMIELIGKNA